MFFKKKKKIELQFDYSACWQIKPTQDIPEFEEIEFLYNKPPEIESPSFDAPVLINALPRIMPSDAIAFLEGAPTSPQVIESLEAIEFVTPTQIEGGTIWPRPRYFHVPLTVANAEIIASLFERNSIPEICYHFHVYADHRMLLYWHDAFYDDPFYVTGAFDEQKVASFCKEIGGTYTKMSE